MATINISVKLTYNVSYFPKHSMIGVLGQRTLSMATVSLNIPYILTLAFQYLAIQHSMCHE